MAVIPEMETRVLNQGATRNLNRFPQEFDFQRSQEEFDSLISQFVTSKTDRGVEGVSCRRYSPNIASLCFPVLRSKRAIQINIGIIKTFVRMRKMLATHKDLARKVEIHDKEIAGLYEYLQQLLEQPPPSKRKIGYLQK